MAKIKKLFHDKMYLTLWKKILFHDILFWIVLPSIAPTYRSVLDKLLIIKVHNKSFYNVDNAPLVSCHDDCLHALAELGEKINQEMHRSQKLKLVKRFNSSL